MVTIFDVAKEAGVSKSTVSRVVNHDPRVKDDTRLAVENAIRKLNYSPSFMAQAIRTRKTHTIALMVPEYSNIFYTEMLRGVEDIALKHGYLIMVCNTERHAMSEIEYIQELMKRNIDGIIYNSYRMDDKMAEYLHSVEEKIPVVYMNKPYSGQQGQSHVYTDGMTSTRNAVHYLYEKGKHNIGYVLNSEDISIIEDRFYGYQQGLRDCGLTEHEEWIFRVQREHEPDYVKLGRDAARYYLSCEHRPDAILTAIDMIGIGCVKELQSAGVKIPQEISVIGFDNVFLSELIDPPLTTIGQPIRQMGQAAAELLIAMMENRECERTVVFDGTLIVRATT